MVKLLTKYVTTNYALGLGHVLVPSTDVIQLTLTLRMTTAQVVETSVTVDNNSPIQDYILKSLLSNTSLRWTPRVGPCLPLVTPFIWLSVRQTSLLNGHLGPVLNVSILERFDCIPGGGGTVGILGWRCAPGTLDPWAYTRSSSAEICYPILD